MRRAPGTLLHVVHPEAVRPPPGRTCEAYVVERLSAGSGAGCLAQRVSALYVTADPRSAALAQALADRLWLRAHAFAPDHLPELHRAGALDQLGRQHAGGEVLLVAPRHAVEGVLEHLLRSGRATPGPCPGAGFRQLGLEDGRDAVLTDPQPRSDHDADTRPHDHAAPVRRRRDCARRRQ